MAAGRTGFNPRAGFRRHRDRLAAMRGSAVRRSAALRRVGAASCLADRRRLLLSPVAAPEGRAQRAELQKGPGSLVLEKDYAPQDCFGLLGRVDGAAKGERQPLLVAAFDHAGPVRGARRIARDHPGGRLLRSAASGGEATTSIFFADLNHDGFYESNEVVGRTPRTRPSRSAPGALAGRHHARAAVDHASIGYRRPSSIEDGVRVSGRSRALRRRVGGRSHLRPGDGRAGRVSPQPVPDEDAEPGSSRSACRTSRRSISCSSTASTARRATFGL